MKFEIKTELIKDYLKRLSSSVQSISSRIEFTGILLSVWDNSITFETRNDYTDTRIEESSLEGVKIIETGRLLVKASTLNEIVQGMIGETIIFSKIDENILLVEDKNSNYKINLLTQENYERVDIKTNLDSMVTLSGNSFRSGVSKTVFAGNENHVNFIYQGLNIYINNGVFSTTVCDGIRIASYKTNINSNLEINKIIPLKVVKEMLKTLPYDSEYTFHFSHNKGVVVALNMLVQFSLIEGTFPIFDKFLTPSIYNKKLVIDRDIFDNGVERSILLNKNKADLSNRIGIILSESEMIIESKDQETGSSKIEIKDFEYTGEKINISISPKILHDGLKNSDSEKVELLLTESKSSMLLKNKDGSFTYLMSPMV